MIILVYTTIIWKLTFIYVNSFKNYLKYFFLLISLFETTRALDELLDSLYYNEKTYDLLLS